MPNSGPTDRAPWPAWVFAVALALAVTEPLVRVWLAYGLPDGQVSSGFRILDDVFFVHPMRMFEAGFFSPFASCTSPYGEGSPAYFALSFHWLYGVLGSLGRIAGVGEFFWLGWCNGVCAFVSLLAAYHLLRTLAPAHASRAFLVYALGGGLGGLLYAATGLLGLHGHDTFDSHFMRFAIHELVEGPHLSPILLFPRLYYTLALATGYWAFARVIRNRDGAYDLVLTGVLFAVTAWINLRVCAPLAALAVLWSALSQGPKVRPIASIVVGAGVGFSAVFLVLRLNPTTDLNNFSVVDRTMYLTAFASATVFAWPALARVLMRRMGDAPSLYRIVIGGSLGYLAVYTVLFFGVLAYYGSGLSFWDYGPPPVISDWALAGFLLGGLGASRLRKSSTGDAGDWRDAYVAMWLLVGVCVAMSAWGQGWFARYAPLRVMPLLGIPFAILVAQGLALWRERRPRFAAAQFTAILSGGVVSILVSLLYFQGPLGREPGEGPFAWNHAEVISQPDHALLEGLPAGRYLAPMRALPPSIADILTVRRGIQVVVGYGTLDHSDRLFEPLEAGAKHFFDPAATDTERKAFVEDVCAEYVYCPDTWPVADETLAQFEALPWLVRMAGEGMGRVYRVAMGD